MTWKRRGRAPRETPASGDHQTRVVYWGTGQGSGCVTVKADRPIRLVFERLGSSLLDESVAIPALGWVSTLGESARCVVDLRPCPAGAYAIASVDGALRGFLLVEP